MLSLLFLAGGLAAASPGPRHHARQAANSSITSAVVTGTAVHNCSWTWDQWLSSSVDAEYDTRSANRTTTYTYYNLTASVTTECDNVTRIVGDLTTVATGYNTTRATITTNFTQPPPTCTPAPADCSDIQLGWGTYPCARPTSNIASSCGQCSIWGGTVDLIYFPITATTSHNLCPEYTVSPGSPTICPLGPTTASRNATNPYDYQPCYYATGNATSTTNSGPYVVSDGHTFYQNRAYISLQTAYASDRCGIVGEKHEGTILELKSQDVYSVGGYHHEFQDAGYQFNFQDLEAVPSYAYYLDCNAGGPASCYYEGTRYRYGTDFINGHSDIDLGESGRGSTDKQWIFQEAYTPILLLPTQIRDLDPAWATCSLNLGGLYDPPKALTQAATQPGPTTPVAPGGGDDGTTAQPGDGPTTPGPTPTAGPTPTGGDDQPTDTPEDPTGGGDDDGTPGPTTPNDPDQPEPTGTDPGSDDPTTPDDPTPSNGAGGNDDDGDDDGQNGDDGPDDDSPDPVTTPDIGGIIISAVVPTTTTQNIGGVIASIIGEGQDDQNDEDGQDAPAPAPAPTPSSGSDDQDTPSPAPSPSGDDQAAPAPAPAPSSENDDNGSPDDDNDGTPPAPAPVTFTADDGSEQTVSAVQGTSDVFVIGEQTVTAGGSATEIAGQTISAGSSGQIVVGSQTITAPTAPEPSDISGPAPAPVTFTAEDGSAQTISAVQGTSGVFVVGDQTVTEGSSGIVVAGETVSAGSSGQVVVGSQTVTVPIAPESSNVADAAPTGSDGSVISISTVTSGSSGVYVADGTTLSVGGDEQTVNGATLSAAPTGVIDVNDESSSGSGSSQTGSSSSPQQTGNTAATIAKADWLSSTVACAFVAIVAWL